MQIGNLRESPLIQMGEEGKRQTPWWLAYVLTLIYALVIVMGLVALLGAVLNPKPGSFLDHAQELLVFGVLYLFAFLWLRFYEGRGFSSLGFRGRGALAKLVLGLVIGSALNAVAALIDVALGGYTFGPAPDPGLGLPVIALVVVSLGIVLVQATGEEFWFRGFVLQSSARALPGIVAILLPAAGFWATHMIFDPIGLLNLLLFAVFATLVALRQGSLWLVAGIHTGWNWVMGNVLGAPVSGIAPREVTLWTLTPNGDASMLNGGTLGIEGTVGALGLWIVCVAVAFLYFRSGSRAAA